MADIPDEKLNLPESLPSKTAADWGLTAARAVTAAIPVLGGPIVEFISIFGSPVERRREETYQLVLAAIKEVQERKPDFDPTDEAFVSAVLHVTRASAGTHQQEKREYLRNALVNIGTGAQPDADKQQLFLNAIDTMTVAHIQVLDVLGDGPQMLHKRGAWHPNYPGRPGAGFTNYSDAIAELCPGMKGQLALVQCVMMDLFSRGFSGVRRPEDSFPQPAVTNLGIEFLTFVRVALPP